MKKFYSEHLYAHYLDYTISLLLDLLYQIQLNIAVSIHLFYILEAFQNKL